MMRLYQYLLVEVLHDIVFALVDEERVHPVAYPAGEAFQEVWVN
jgi:hypothetical protein